MGAVIQFRPRSNAKADRAFWIGGDSPIQDTTPYPDPSLEEYLASACYESSTSTKAASVDVALAALQQSEGLWIDTAPCEYLADERDPA